MFGPKRGAPLAILAALSILLAACAQAPAAVAPTTAPTATAAPAAGGEVTITQAQGETGGARLGHRASWLDLSSFTV